MRKIKRPKIGETVLVSMFHDKNPLDPWHISVVTCIMECKDGVSVRVLGANDFWTHIWRGSQEEMSEWLKVNNGSL